MGWMLIARLIGANLFLSSVRDSKLPAPAPAARQKIARRFNGGFRASNHIQSRRDGRILLPHLPPLRGLIDFWNDEPAAKAAGHFHPSLRDFSQRLFPVQTA